MSKQRDDLAKEIYLKKLPYTSITEQTKRSFESAAEQAYEMADVFLAEKQKQNRPNPEFPVGTVIVPEGAEVI